MKLLNNALLALALTGALGCTTNEMVESAGPAAAPAANAELRDAAGRVRARAEAEEVGQGVRIRVEAAEMASGAYGAHVHTVGRCDPPAFTSAGAHWNPGGRQHGKDNPQGMHLGDLPNLMVGNDGRGSLEYIIPNAGLRTGANPMLDGDGASVVIHAAPDDYRTDPSGNSGARTACGVLG
jgi:superoxide dismutase, Cu-Zn family